MCVLIYSNIIACTDSLYFYGPVIDRSKPSTTRENVAIFISCLNHHKSAFHCFNTKYMLHTIYIFSCLIQSRILLCNKQEKIYCLQHKVIKFITLLLPCNGVSLKIILITLKPNLSEDVMYIHVCMLNFLQRGNIFYT